MKYAIAQLGAGAPVTPSDTEEFAPSYILVMGAGSVAIRPAEGNVTSLVIPAVPAGSLLPILAIRVLSTGTTATNIIRCF